MWSTIRFFPKSDFSLSLILSFMMYSGERTTCHHQPHTHSLGLAIRQQSHHHPESSLSDNKDKGVNCPTKLDNLKTSLLKINHFSKKVLSSQQHHYNIMTPSPPDLSLVTSNTRRQELKLENIFGKVHGSRPTILKDSKYSDAYLHSYTFYCSSFVIFGDISN